MKCWFLECTINEKSKRGDKHTCQTEMLLIQRHFWMLLAACLLVFWLLTNDGWAFFFSSFFRGKSATILSAKLPKSKERSQHEKWLTPPQYFFLVNIILVFIVARIPGNYSHRIQVQFFSIFFNFHFFFNDNMNPIWTDCLKWFFVFVLAQHVSHICGKYTVACVWPDSMRVAGILSTLIIT